MMTVFLIEADSPRATIRSATDDSGTRHLAGECKRCGMCCQAVDCKFLDWETFQNQPRAVCRIYNTRPIWCALWPEPDDTIPDPCGYQWLNN